MALNWDWNKKIGEATFTDTYNGDNREYTVNLYNGNAVLIFIHEFEEDGRPMWQMSHFWADLNHMKSCLGLKGVGGLRVDENILNREYGRLTKIRLDKKNCKYLKDITQALIQAFDKLVIEIY